MKTIWKYKITEDEIVQLKMPKESKFLHVGMQFGEIFVWCLVDTEKENETVSLKVYGTGENIDIDETYIGTFMLANGAYVFHLFNITP